MTALVLYDSQFGNTENLAKIIALKLNAVLVNCDNFNPQMLSNISLLIVGSPTQGGRPKQRLLELITNLPSRSLNGIKVAAFDTRMDAELQRLPLKLLIKTIGYAAPKIVTLLIDKGGTSTCEPQGFIVKGKEGPLAIGEENKAVTWAANLK